MTQGGRRAFCGHQVAPRCRREGGVEPLPCGPLRAVKLDGLVFCKRDGEVRSGRPGAAARGRVWAPRLLVAAGPVVHVRVWDPSERRRMVPLMRCTVLNAGAGAEPPMQFFGGLSSLCCSWTHSYGTCRKGALVEWRHPIYIYVEPLAGGDGATIYFTTYFLSLITYFLFGGPWVWV